MLIGDPQRKPVLDDDILAYSVYEYGNGMVLYTYDTSSGEHTMLQRSDDNLKFAFSPDGRIAFSTGWIWQSDGELFIMDASGPDQLPLNLSNEVNMVGYPLGWSADGNYLAFASVVDDRQQAIYIWDGITAIEITPENTLGNPHSFDIAWSQDGRLAFTTWFGFTGDDPNPEIYIWDGETTFNLSQNPDAEDRAPIWNTNGEVAFGSIIDNDYILLLWDGTSYIDGSPDASSFTRIAPQLDIFDPFSSWINDDLLAFVAYEPGNSVTDIFTWDGEIWSNVSQKPNSWSYAPEWSPDGYWAFIDPDIPGINVRDENYDTVFQTEGLQPAWSSGGSLAFCRRENPGHWKLLLWDRATVSTLAEGQTILGQWRSGQTTSCTDG